jgi:hypothetical protein
VDLKTREVGLKDADASADHARAENIKNLDKVKVGDTITTRRITVRGRSRIASPAIRRRRSVLGVEAGRRQVVSATEHSAVLKVDSISRGGEPVTVTGRTGRRP